MTFASPLAFWWLAIAIPIAALFFFRIRPTEIIVPTLALWERFIRSSEYHGFGIRFGRWPTLLIQLLIVALLVLALSNPRTSESRPVIVVLDDSATMQTRDPDGRTRFDEARAAALARIHADARTGVAAIVLAGEPVRILAGRADSPPAQAALLAALAPRDVNADLPRAIRLATVLAREANASSIVTLSDKHPGADTSELPVKWRSVGTQSPNLGIAGLRRSDDGRAIVVTLHQTGMTDKSATLHLAADGREIDRKEVDLAAPTIELTLRAPATDDTQFEIRCDPPDALPLDNVAYGVWTNLPIARVLLVSIGNLPLVAALSQPNIELETIPSDQWPTTRPADVVVLDAIDAELPNLEAARLLVFAGRDPLNLATTTAPALDQRPIKWIPSHPLLRDVDLLTWRIHRTASFGPSPAARPIVGAPDAALVLESDPTGPADAAVREILVNFELKNSNLASRAGFPIFIWNAVQRLLNRSDEQYVLSYATGSPTRATMQCNAARAGFQQVEENGISRTIALNWIPNGSTPAPQSAAAAIIQPQTGAPLWSKLLLAAAALMLVEMTLFSFNVLRLG